MTADKPGFIQQLRSFPPTFYVANTMEIFERMAWYGFYAVSSLYITGPVATGALGFTSEQRGQLQAIVPFFLYLMPVVTGALADRYGYKKLFIVAYVGMVASYYALGQFKTFPTFMIAFMFVAVSAAIFKPVVVGTVARVTNASNSATGFGIFYMMVNVGGFVGPLVAGAVRGISWKWVFIACSTWAFINLLIVLVFYKDPTTESASATKRTLGKVARDMVEVLGNLRFGIVVFVVLIALMVANQGIPQFGWDRCGWFIAAWLLLNFAWDAMLPRRGGDPGQSAAQYTPFFLKRMHCSNWRFALYLFILSGFWTSFNQIFITMPEYIRDFTDTRPMVQAGRTVFGAIGKPNWIDALAAIEEPEVMSEFDTLVRRARSAAPLVAPASAPAKKPESHGAGAKKELTEAEKRERLERDPSIGPATLKRLEELAASLNAPDAARPLTAADVADAARTMLGFKVRVTPVEVAELLARVPAGPIQPTEDSLDTAVRSINRRLESKGIPPIAGDTADRARSGLRGLLAAHGALTPADALTSLAAELSPPKPAAAIEPADLAIGVRDLAYRPIVWERIDAGRQVNPEHIVNFDALAIVLLQVIVSFGMARFHRFTTMIVGMVIAAIGLALPALCGGTMIGPLGGGFLLVALGIVIFAIGEMMASPTSQEYVGRIAPPDKVALYMGYYFLAVAMGNLFGGILSGQFYGKLARDMQRPDLMWLAFGGIMLGTAFVFLLYNWFALPRETQPREAAAH